MPPQVPLTSTITEVEDKSGQPREKKIAYKHQIVWRSVIRISILHILAIRGITLIPYVKTWTLAWIVILHILGAIGITAGAHRLWTHRLEAVYVRVFVTLSSTVDLNSLIALLSISKFN